MDAKSTNLYDFECINLRTLILSMEVDDDDDFISPNGSNGPDVQDYPESADDPTDLDIESNDTIVPDSVTDLDDSNGSDNPNGSDTSDAFNVLNTQDPLIEGIYELPKKVRYRNCFCQIGLTSLSANENKLFMIILAYMGENGLVQMSFRFSDLKRFMKVNAHISHKNFNKYIVNLANKLNKTNYKLRNKDGAPEALKFFDVFKSNVEKGILYVRLHPSFCRIIHGISGNEITSPDNAFTEFNLKDYLKLEQKYSMTLFRKLCQFKNIKGKKCYITVNDLRSLFEVKDNETTKNINQYKLYPALEEINEKFKKSPYKDMRLDKSKMKNQKKIFKYYFTWS